MADLSPPPAPPPPPSLDELFYALSQVTFRRKYRPPSPDPTAQETSAGKRLKILNLLSLLLVTSRKGDVAAVTLRLHPKMTQLCYAKNRPCTSLENHYIADLFSIAARTDPSSDHTTTITIKQQEILFKVIIECRRKINSRIQRLCCRLKDLSMQNFSISTDACEDALATAKFIRDNIGDNRFMRHEPLESFLKDFFKNFLATIWATESAGAIYELLMISYYVGNSPAIKNILDENLLNCLRKVGDYFAAPIAITTVMATLTTSQLENLSIVEVIPEPPHTLQLPVDFLTTINNWACHSGSNPITATELDAPFPDRADPPSPSTPPMKPIKTSVHCECTLVLALFASGPAASVYEIGVSKSLCWMCREFMLIVKRMCPDRSIYTSPCHGKIVAGWRLPENASWELVRAVTKRVHDEVDEVLERAARKRRSDPLPRGTGSEHGDAKADPKVVLSLLEERLRVGDGLRDGLGEGERKGNEQAL